MSRGSATDSLSILAVPLIVFAIVGVFLGFIVGLVNGIDGASTCNERWHRIEYVVPVYRLGCWLGEAP